MDALLNGPLSETGAWFLAASPASEFRHSVHSSGKELLVRSDLPHEPDLVRGGRSFVWRGVRGGSSLGCDDSPDYVVFFCWYTRVPK